MSRNNDVECGLPAYGKIAHLVGRADKYVNTRSIGRPEKPLTDEEKEKMSELKEEGYSFQKISDKTGMKYIRVWRYFRRREE